MKAENTQLDHVGRLAAAIKGDEKLSPPLDDHGDSKEEEIPDKA